MKITLTIDSDTKQVGLAIDDKAIDTSTIRSLSSGWYNWVDDGKEKNDTYFSLTQKASDGNTYSLGFSFNDKMLDKYENSTYSISDNVAGIVKNHRYLQTAKKFLIDKK